MGAVVDALWIMLAVIVVAMLFIGTVGIIDPGERAGRRLAPVRALSPRRARGHGTPSL